MGDETTVAAAPEAQILSFEEALGGSAVEEEPIEEAAEGEEAPVDDGLEEVSIGDKKFRVDPAVAKHLKFKEEFASKQHSEKSQIQNETASMKGQLESLRSEIAALKAKPQTPETRAEIKDAEHEKSLVLEAISDLKKLEKAEEFEGGALSGAVAKVYASLSAKFDREMNEIKGVVGQMFAQVRSTAPNAVMAQRGERVRGLVQSSAALQALGATEQDVLQEFAALDKSLIERGYDLSAYIDRPDWFESAMQLAERNVMARLIQEKMGKKGEETTTSSALPAVETKTRTSRAGAMGLATGRSTKERLESILGR